MMSRHRRELGLLQGVITMVRIGGMRLWSWVLRGENGLLGKYHRLSSDVSDEIKFHWITGADIQDGLKKETVFCIILLHP